MIVLQALVIVMVLANLVLIIPVASYARSKGYHFSVWFAIVLLLTSLVGSSLVALLIVHLLEDKSPPAGPEAHRTLF